MFLPSRPRERKDLWTSREAYRAQAGDTVDSLHKQAMNMALGSEQLIVSARHGVG
jgi:phage tail protein X